MADPAFVSIAQGEWQTIAREIKKSDQLHHCPICHQWLWRRHIKQHASMRANEPFFQTWLQDGVPDLGQPVSGAEPSLSLSCAVLCQTCLCQQLAQDHVRRCRASEGNTGAGDVHGNGVRLRSIGCPDDNGVNHRPRTSSGAGRDQHHSNVELHLCLIEITSILLPCYQSMYRSCNTTALHVVVVADVKVLGSQY